MLAVPGWLRATVLGLCLSLSGGCVRWPTPLPAPGIFSPKTNATNASGLTIEQQLLGVKLDDQGNAQTSKSVAWRKTAPQKTAREQWLHNNLHKSEESSNAPNDTPPKQDQYHWQHDGLRDVLRTSSNAQRDLRQAIESANPVVAATATIGLARLEPRKHHAALLRISQQGILPVKVRQAAVETLSRDGHSSTPDDLRRLISVWDSESGTEDEELHVELLSALALPGKLHTEPAFAKALDHGSTRVRTHVLDLYTKWPESFLPKELSVLLSQRFQEEVRVKTLLLYAKRPRSELPSGITSLYRSPSPRIREAMLRTLVAHKHPRMMEFLDYALVDSMLNVRLAAVKLLGVVGDGQSQEILQEMLAENPQPVVAAAVIYALAKADDMATVYAAADNEAWKVRQAIADNLRWDSEPSATACATKLLADKDDGVRDIAIRAVGSWPLTESGPLLLSALGAKEQSTRQAAANALGRKWPAVREFPAGASVKVRRAKLTQITQQWEQEFPQAVRLQASNETR